MTDLNEESLIEFLASEDVIETMTLHKAAVEDNRKFMAKTSIVMCVCTRNRPEMFRGCLESLLRQKVPDDTRLSVVVVCNNETSGGTYDVVAEVCQRVSSACWVSFVHEPDTGIPQARNAALADALDRKADWIAFIDDDEIASPAWISDAYRAAVCYQADVVQGRVEQVYPEGTPEWMRRGVWRPERGVKPIDFALTNNVLFRADAVRRAKVTFDERLRFIGGEDKAFFTALKAGGAVMLFCPQPLVWERLPPERVTFRWQLRNAFRKGVCKVTEAEYAGKRHIRINAAISAVRASVSCVAKVLVSPVVMLVGPSRGAYVFLSGCRDGAKAFGSVMGLFGYQFEYYKRTTGY